MRPSFSSNRGADQKKVADVVSDLNDVWAPRMTRTVNFMNKSYNIDFSVVTTYVAEVPLNFILNSKFVVFLSLVINGSFGPQD